MADDHRCGCCAEANRPFARCPYPSLVRTFGSGTSRDCLDGSGLN